MLYHQKVLTNVRRYNGELGVCTPVGSGFYLQRIS